MIYFTSDLHIGDDRIGINDKPNVFYRPFKTIDEQNNTILNNLKYIKKTDKLIVVGDVIYNIEYVDLLKKLPTCKKYLIIGNYDEKYLDDLEPYFDEISINLYIKLGKYEVILNHYPIKCLDKINKDEKIDFGITGHIHGLWKVQKKLINVSTDAWHFKPVSEDEIKFCYNSMQKHYDKNVFPY